MPPHPGLRVHEGVAAERMAVDRPETEAGDHDHRARRGTERDAIPPAAQKESEPHASGREQGARAAEERSPHRESRSDQARERSVVRQEKSEGEAEEEDLARRREERLPHAGERGRAECEQGERCNRNVLSEAAPHTGKEKKRRGDGHQRGQVLLGAVEERLGDDPVRGGQSHRRVGDREDSGSERKARQDAIPIRRAE